MRTTLHIILSAVCLLFANGRLQAQQSACLAPNIKTLQVLPDGEWGEPPLIFLGGSKTMEISFDDLQSSFVRYTYTITHCNADWTPSDMITSQYMDGFNDQRIEDYEPSIGMAMDYNHYWFSIPNEDVQLKVSGNYKVEIREDGEDEPVVVACFSVVEPRVGINVEITGNTDIDSWEGHQQLDISINYRNYPVQNPIEDLRPVVMQNRRWDTHVEGIKPTYVRTNELIFTHNHSLIFDAGNEYRRFEVLDDHIPTMRVDRMRLVDDYYHAILMEDHQRINYLFDRDQNGRYYVRNGDDEDSDFRSEYYYTHFTLQTPALPGGEVYVCGDFTDNMFRNDNLMTYDPLTHAYEAVIPLKQGSYNYQYLFVPDGEERGYTQPLEGNFHQTENEYWVYVYHRPFGERYDRLVGFTRISNEVAK